MTPKPMRDPKLFISRASRSHLARFVVPLLLAACGGEETRTTPQPGTGSAQAGSSGAAGAARGAGTGGAGGRAAIAGAGTSAPTPANPITPVTPNAGAPAMRDEDAGTGGGVCSAVDLQSNVRKVPVDIVWAIDSSGSMREERDAIQQSLNAFAEKFASAALDVRVVVITDEGDVEVPAPLGTDQTRFLLVDRNVGSDEALEVFIDRFEDYSGFLRPDAKLELIAVTDDESDISAVEFIDEMKALVRKDFRLHAIASERVDGDACDGARSPGDEYYAAAGLTKGLTFSVCEADRTELFTELGNGLTMGAPLPCSLDVPAAPAGQQLDPTLVNVVYEAPDNKSRATIPRVTDSARCSDRGWFYDNATAPRVLTLCPQTCESMRIGNLHVTFGCATAVAL